MNLVLNLPSRCDAGVIFRRKNTAVFSSYRLCGSTTRHSVASRLGRFRNRKIIVRATAAEETAPPIADATIRVKIMLAEGSGKLDLSECGLPSIPAQVFELTELEELSLAGNNISILPPEIGKLTLLERLQLSGNELKHFPEEIGELKALKGLWVHGNRLQSLPDLLPKLTNLVQLSIAGNEIKALPEGIGSLSSLKELAAAGNKIKTIPEALEGLKSLEILGLYGNKLTSLPSSVATLAALREFWVQGNPYLTSLPAEIGEIQALQHFSAADCALTEIPEAFAKAPALKTLSFYGNKLKYIPPTILNAPHLSAIYLEGNPLEADAVSALIEGAQSSGISAIGMDTTQLLNLDDSKLLSPNIKISEIHGTGPGYFKLEKSPQLLSSTSTASNQFSKVLVVAFGSAPGVPNWGGLLKRIRTAGTEPAHNDFDVLYVVDPYRGWYCGGDDDVEYSKIWEKRLEKVTRHYDHVVMIGDSMGATASLLFAGQATSVHAFCPQIDLAASSIRPGQGPEWGTVLRKRALDGIASCKGKVTIHVGNWKHDLDQAIICPKEAANVKIYSIESHRLAIALDRAGKLLPAMRAAILNEMGLSANNVRVSNLL
ncbi:putative Leucine-rich repeat-containing protein 1 [Nannochloris sp. 'desiccata']|nr:putative Leucine-rich repeat-containing protein 1 [Chlorella desiccata (nom. nud.)]